MKTLLTILLFLGINTMIFGQGIKASFTLKALPDNSWKLKLYKDNTYKYLHWSGFGGSPTILDSGRYSINDSKLIIESKIDNNEKGLSTSYFYIHEIKVKRHQQIIGFIPKHKKNSLFSKKYLILSPNKYAESYTISLRPKDRIEINTLDSNVIHDNWVSATILTRYGYSNIQQDKISWFSLLKNDKIEVVLISNAADLFNVFYLVNNYIYTSSMHKSLNGQKEVIKKLVKEKHLTRKERKYLIAEIQNRI